MNAMSLIYFEIFYNTLQFVCPSIGAASANPPKKTLTNDLYEEIESLRIPTKKRKIRRRNVMSHANFSFFEKR